MSTALKVSPKQILAYRLAAQGVRDRGKDPLAALAGWAVQESPPGAAATAALNRTRASAELGAGWLDGAIQDDRSVIALYNARTATSVVPVKEAASFGTALIPGDDAGLKAIVANAVPEQNSGYDEPVGLGIDAISEALDGRSLSRDDLHERLRGLLPGALLPWCEGCRSHHARRGLLVMASLHGRLCLSGREGRQPVFSRTDQWASWKAPAAATARKALVTRYLGWYGPSTPADLAAWAGVAKSHAAELWATVEDDLLEVDAGRKAWILDADRGALDGADAASAEGVRLLGPGDPLLQAKDRAVLLDDAGAAKKLWTAIPTTGLVLDGTTAVAIWKAKKAGKRLDLTATALGRRKPDLDPEAQRLATLRGCPGGARVSWT